jgi:hypothetical protein
VQYGRRQAMTRENKSKLHTQQNAPKSCAAYRSPTMKALQLAAHEHYPRLASSHLHYIQPSQGEPAWLLPRHPHATWRVSRLALCGTSHRHRGEHPPCKILYERRTETAETAAKDTWEINYLPCGDMWLGSVTKQRAGGQPCDGLLPSQGHARLGSLGASQMRHVGGTAPAYSRVSRRGVAHPPSQCLIADQGSIAA